MVLQPNWVCQKIRLQKLPRLLQKPRKSSQKHLRKCVKVVMLIATKCVKREPKCRQKLTKKSKQLSPLSKELNLMLTVRNRQKNAQKECRTGNHIFALISVFGKSFKVEVHLETFFLHDNKSDFRLLSLCN